MLGNASQIWASLVLDAANVPAYTSVEATVTIAGAKLGDIGTFMPRGAVASGLTYAGARGTADNTVKLLFVNGTNAAINPASDTYDICLNQRRGEVETAS
jgi:hypothetical protein